MRTVDLREYDPSQPVQLSVGERDRLHRIAPSLTIEPAIGEEGAYRLTPGSHVGAFESGRLSVSIRPKLAIARVLFLASYAMGAFKLRDLGRFDFAAAPTLVEALALALADAARPRRQQPNARRNRRPARVDVPNSDPWNRRVTPAMAAAIIGMR